MTMTPTSDIKALITHIGNLRNTSDLSFAKYTADYLALGTAIQELVNTVPAPPPSMPGFVAGPNWVQSPSNLGGQCWTPQNVSTAQSQGAALDGTNSLNTVTDDATDFLHRVYLGQINPPAGIYTFSAYLKAGTLRYAQLCVADGGNGNQYGVIFDLQTGAAGDINTLGTPTETSVSIEPTSVSGLYLATVTMYFTGGGPNLYANISAADSPTPSYAYGMPTYVGSGQSFYMWNATLTTPISVGMVYDPPAQPWVTAGYNVNTFHVSSFSTANVDTLLTRNSGFKFYLTGTHGWDDTPASKLTFNGDGSLTLTGAGAGGGGIYSIAAKGTPATDWRGTAFGGGAYFEATLSFDPAPINDAHEANGFPAFWANPVEHAAESSVNADNWQGQPDWFVHYTELDFMEYNVSGSDSRLFQYNGTVIDWSGTWTGSNYPNMHQNSLNRQITLPVGTDFTQPHRYGFLWVPATPTSDGYFQWYFDGLPTSARVTYSYYDPVNPPSPPALGSPWLYGVVDGQHPVLHLNPDAVGSLRIYSVDVWQASSVGNITK